MSLSLSFQTFYERINVLEQLAAEHWMQPSLAPPHTKVTDAVHPPTKFGFPVLPSNNVNNVTSTTIIILSQALTLAMCLGFFLGFFSASYAAIIFTGNRQNSEGNVNSYLFFVIGLGLMYKSVQLHA